MLNDSQLQLQLGHEIKATTSKVLLFPANGDQPCVVDMIFSAAGAKSHPRGFYNTAVDLRGLYGKYTAGYTRLLNLSIQDHGEQIDGQYHLYYNVSPRLPVNYSMARIIGVDPKRPSSRPMWKGDVVIVKMQQQDKEPQSMSYLDISIAVQETAEKIIRGWYNSDMWAPNARIHHESLDCESFSDRCVSHDLVDVFVVHLANEDPTDPCLKLLKDSGGYELVTEEKKRRKQEKILERIVADEKKRLVRYDKFGSNVCADCGASNLPARSQCSKCKRVFYCSVECQRRDWREHKEHCT
ncbi:uncharacterized protein EV420DRAFT_252700 [Desarmillaria tabescens]|uniref:MYND-type domain-containing protein n=1 Tax=Armillaria tabescens TaxID=1929756 RepID=A0AA39N6N0_ARMTA|nr:uncharacterized protein EV420DRAFT_252700 [Desarmillaria tabescens]KAK0460126.1 hypothetical protein EV420DRAFT_252700 [Desarmillaria tabescens]